MRQRLLALAALVSAAGAGTLVLADWDTGLPVNVPPGGFEVLDRSDCTPAVCGLNACDNANNVLADAGDPCRTRLVACDVRIGGKARAWLSDAGLTLGPKPYQRIQFIGLRCPAADGGFAFGVPMDDNGLPQFVRAVAQTPRCVRAPVGNTTCLRAETDGGSRFFGEMNVFPSGEARGAGCEACGCVHMAGDSDEDL